MKKILLVPEINFVNFPLYLILSLVCEVKTYFIPFLLTKLKGNIEFIDLADYYDWERGIAINSEAVEIWKDISTKLPKLTYKLKVGNDAFELSSNILKELQKEVDLLIAFKNIKPYGSKDHIFIVNSLKLAFLAKVTQVNELFCYPTLKSLSAIHVLLDRVNLAVFNFCCFFRVIFQLLYGLVYNKASKHKIKYIYDGVAIKELSVERDKITFSWLVDNKIIHENEILFVLPSPGIEVGKQLKKYCQHMGLLTTTYFRMFAFCSRAKLFALITEISKVFFRILFNNYTLGSLLVTKYNLRIIKWVPLVESLSPKVYITTFNCIGQENASMVYFKGKGIRTVEWFYSTNSYAFLPCAKAKKSNFNTLIFCNFIAQTLVSWNQHFKEFIEQHPQEGAEVKAIGPLMSGNEDVMRVDKKALCGDLNLPYAEDLKYISMFDIPPILNRKRGGFALRPYPASAEYNWAFVKDVYKLLSEFPNVILLYKPKRSISSEQFGYSVELKELFVEMRKDPRVVILDYNINPWIPVALADLCVSIPFESPNIAALHYNKPAIFHDALNLAHYHRYQKIAKLITHNYEQLRSLVKNILFNSSRAQFMPNIDELSEFIGVEPGTNSSERFRSFLKTMAISQNSQGK